MANKKVKHIIAKNTGTSATETLDVYDADALHIDNIRNNLSTSEPGYVLDARQGRELQKALSNSILNYGGVEDGVTNNTAAFNTCMAVHGSVYLPNITGSGYVLDQITLTNGQSVIGNSTKIIFNGSNSHLFLITGSYISIKGLRIEHPNRGSTFSISGTSQSFIKISDILTTNSSNFITDANSSGLHTLIYLDHCTARLQRGVGFLFKNVLAFLFLSYCTVDNVGISPDIATWRCFDIYNNHGMHISHCEAEGGYIDGSSPTNGGFVFENCEATWIDNSFADTLDGSGFYFTNCQYLHMMNSGTSYCGGYGIFYNGDYSEMSNIYVGTQITNNHIGLCLYGGTHHSISNVTFNTSTCVTAHDNASAIISGGTIITGTLNVAAPVYYRDILSNNTLLTNIT